MSKWQWKKEALIINPLAEAQWRGEEERVVVRGIIVILSRLDCEPNYS